MNDDNWTTLQSAGKVPPPSPEVLAHAAQRVEQAATRNPRRTVGRRVLVPALAATATAAVIGVVALQQSNTPTALPVAPSTTPSVSTYPPSRPLENQDKSPLCVASYPKELQKRGFGFDGTVLSAVQIPRTAYYWAVTFQVHEWYRPGRSPQQVTVQMLGGPNGQVQLEDQVGYEIGDRLLISGASVDSRTGKALKYPIGWACGFSRTYDVPTADTWRKVFSK
ncbi:hypothetical protein E1263_20690 [Kribbella antibiotica]|uniref:Uncharacterized protein n=1 Tax=Kribbella antibiotica TaxID=190195 RepID=A0A4V2YPF4_9ACTN|nr:hypothetical protein [Kribbella antibiotica]TDD58067.1 hypothetical protein E1263_20690 [Kribbella antibiotica]